MNYKFLIFVILLCIISCEKTPNLHYEKYSKELIGNTQYEKIYSLITDSINFWTSNDLSNYKMQKYSTKWKVNSLQCYNSKKDKFVSCLMNIKSSEVSNSLNFFYGVKIKDTWYFFTGTTVYCFSELFGMPEGQPLSFEKLHEIALKEVFSGYLKKKDRGFLGNIWGIFFPEYEPDEAWFDRHFRGVGWGCGKYVDKDGDGNYEQWIDTCTEEQFNAIYSYPGHWMKPADKSLFNTAIQRWTYITTDSFNKLFAAKIIDSFGNPIGTIYDDPSNSVIRPNVKTN